MISSFLVSLIKLFLTDLPRCSYHGVAFTVVFTVLLNNSFLDQLQWREKGITIVSLIPFSPLNILQVTSSHWKSFAVVIMFFFVNNKTMCSLVKIGIFLINSNIYSQGILMTPLPTHFHSLVSLVTVFNLMIPDTTIWLTTPKCFFLSATLLLYPWVFLFNSLCVSSCSLFTEVLVEI